MTEQTKEPVVFDDAGGGNILGGLVIGALHGEAYANRIIGPEWFSMGKGIRSIISSTVLELVKEFDSPSHVILCRSDLFDQTARDLERLGFRVERAVINGKLQDRAELDFFEHLMALGLPRYIMTLFPGEDTDKSRCYRSLNQYCTSFLLSDFSTRHPSAKKNSRSFHKLRAIKLDKKFRDVLNGSRPRRCIECGEAIVERAYLCKGGTTVFYVHENCAPWEKTG